MKNKLRGYLIDLKGEGREVAIEAENSEERLKAFYELLSCDLIDIVSYKVGLDTYDIIIDDEGLFKEDITPSLVTAEGKVQLVGPLLFLHGNEETGEEVSLDDMDIINLKAHTLKHQSGYDVICSGEPYDFIKNQKKAREARKDK